MEELVRLSKSFSDINRLKIIALISREKELCVCEISDTLDIAQPLVSRHLKQLKSAGVLDSRQAGKWMLYSIDPRPHDIVLAYLETLRKSGEKIGQLVTCSSRE